MYDHRFHSRTFGRRTGTGERFDQRHRSGKLQTTWLLHFTHHEDLLAAVLVDGDADLRVVEIPGGQKTFSHLVLDRADAHSASRHPAEQWHGECAVGFDDKLARQLRLGVARDGEVLT